MKIGLIGACDGNAEELHEAVDFMMGDVGVELLVYLGADDTITAAARKWAAEEAPGELDENAFLTKVAAEVKHGGVAELDAIFEQDAALDRLSTIRRLPPAPARAIEMIGDKIITLVWDKAVLGEEDIANAFFTVYGKSKKMLFKRFGPRYFFTPGPLSGGHIGVLEQEGDSIALSLFSPAGVPISRELLHTGNTAKLSVSS